MALFCQDFFIMGNYTVSAELIDFYKTPHETGRYGQSSLNKCHYILPHIETVKPNSVIDYGCGRSRLVDLIQHLGVPNVAHYDPAIPAYAEKPPSQFDLLISVDVLEHIPEDELDAILSDMAGLGRNAILVINTRLARTILPDGRNAHLTVRPALWWRQTLSRYWADVEQITMHPAHQVAFKTWPTRWAHFPRIVFSRQWHKRNRKFYQQAIELTDASPAATAARTEPGTISAFASHSRAPRPQ